MPHKSKKACAEYKCKWYLKKTKAAKARDAARQRARRAAGIDAHQRRKRFLIDTLGGRCLLCRFSGIPAALHAHHLDPKTKHPRLIKFRTPIATLRESDFYNEVKKCVLLCANCHCGVESGWLDLKTALIPFPYWP